MYIRSFFSSHLPASFMAPSLSSATIPGSASVEISPSSAMAIAGFSASLRKIRRMIFPERVFGKPSENCIASGVAMGPISLRTIALSSLVMSSLGTCPSLSTT